MKLIHLMTGAYVVLAVCATISGAILLRDCGRAFDITAGLVVASRECEAKCLARNAPESKYVNGRCFCVKAGESAEAK